MSKSPTLYAVPEPEEEPLDLAQEIWDMATAMNRVIAEQYQDGAA